MPTFKPIDSGISMKTSLSTLDRLVLDSGALEAEFFIPEDANRRLQVAFPHVEIMRTLDEMPLSTEETEKWVGLNTEHFAYEVVGAHFWKSQSWAFKEVHKDLKHYVFITGWTCLDVISRHPPRFSIVGVPEARRLAYARWLEQ
ncbi:hypothetical protein [Bradyrhizobium canariense]|uniref:Uncharacterized protein n=1 Tax=Bradyrhizobium canariense TaxID=255045 RepID=A0A1H1NIM3_9BRAD|nr:hypothetical protein [Bradyrhizobium canariense]SDR98822.1 hypothetical protein SAMN05444158_0642 [Bradyrhizobium canariense]